MQKCPGANVVGLRSTSWAGCRLSSGGRQRHFSTCAMGADHPSERTSLLPSWSQRPPGGPPPDPLEEKQEGANCNHNSPRIPRTSRHQRQSLSVVSSKSTSHVHLSHVHVHKPDPSRDDPSAYHFRQVSDRLGQSVAPLAVVWLVACRGEGCWQGGADGIDMLSVSACRRESQGLLFFLVCGFVHSSCLTWRPCRVSVGRQGPVFPSCCCCCC